MLDTNENKTTQDTPQDAVDTPVAKAVAKTTTKPKRAKKKKNPKDKRLTLKQSRFAHKYVEHHGNASKAVRESYPNVKTDSAQRVIAHKLITQCPNVVQEVERIMQSKGLSVDKLTSTLNGLVTNANAPSEQNKAIRTSLELLQLIGARSAVNVQVNTLTPDILEIMRSALADRFRSDADTHPITPETLENDPKSA